MKGWTTQEPGSGSSTWRIAGYLLLFGVPVATLAFAIKTVSDAINPGAASQMAWANAAAAQATAQAVTASAMALGAVAAIAALGIGAVAVMGVMFTAWQRFDDARREHQLAVLRMQQQLGAGEPRREIVIIGEDGR